MRHLKALSAPQLSPDGTQALFAVTDATADGAKTHLWVARGERSGKGAAADVFAAERQARRAQWRSGLRMVSAIFFLAHRGEHTQLFRLDLRGGEAAPYEMKIVPPVDESKEKDAIPPPGAEKKADDKKADEKKPDDKDAKKDDTLEH